MIDERHKKSERLQHNTREWTRTALRGTRAVLTSDGTREMFPSMLEIPHLALLASIVRARCQLAIFSN